LKSFFVGEKKGSISMIKMNDYVQLDCMQQIEFGLALTIEDDTSFIQVVAVDHKRYSVQSLGTAYSLEDAFSIASTCIKTGFFINGVTFQGIPDYSFMEKTNSLSVV